MKNISELWQKIINNKMQSFVILLFIGAVIVGIFCCVDIKTEIICSNFRGCNTNNIYIPNPNHILLCFAFVATGLTGIVIYNQFKMQKEELEIQKEKYKLEDREKLIQNHLNTMNNNSYIMMPDNQNRDIFGANNIKITDTVFAKVQSFPPLNGLYVIKIKQNGILMPTYFAPYITNDVFTYTGNLYNMYYQFLQTICNSIYNMDYFHRMADDVYDEKKKLILTQIIVNNENYRTDFHFLSAVLHLIKTDGDNIFLDKEKCLQSIGFESQNNTDIDNLILKIKKWEGFNDYDSLRKKCFY